MSIMREPMFRFWLPDEVLPEDRMFYPDGWGEPYLNSKDYVPMLFSQVYDDKSTRIYEDDLLVFGHKNSNAVWKVFFSQGGFWCQPINGDENDTTISLYQAKQTWHIYVIGNVWETDKYKAYAKDTRSAKFLSREGR